MTQSKSESNWECPCSECKKLRKPERKGECISEPMLNTDSKNTASTPSPDDKILFNEKKYLIIYNKGRRFERKRMVILINKLLKNLR